MKFLISGYNEYTKKLIKQLNQDEHEIYVVDPGIDENIASLHDIYPIHGDINDINIIDEIKEFTSIDYYISLDSNDEKNIVSTLLVKNSNLTTKSISLLSKPIYTYKTSKILNEYGNFLISEEVLNHTLIKLVKNKNIFRSIYLFNDSVEIVGTVINNPLIDNMTIENIASMFDNITDFRILFIERNQKVLIPSGKEKLKFNDRIYLFEHSEDVKKLIIFFNEKNIEAEISDENFLNTYQKKKNNIVILGYIDNILPALKILIKNNNITILTKHVNDFDSIDYELSNLNVIDTRGEKINEIEKYIEKCDIFIANEKSDEINFISSMIAKRKNVKKIIPFIKNDQYNDLYLESKIYTYVNINEIYINKILNTINELTILNVASLKSGLEIFEIEATANKKIINKKIKDLNLGKNIIIGIIIRENQFISPVGETKILIGDKLSIITFSSNTKKINKIFEKNK